MFWILFLQEEAQEEFGWKLVHGDVFRSPRRGMFLSVLLGCGSQIFAMTFITLGKSRKKVDCVFYVRLKCLKNLLNKILQWISPIVTFLKVFLTPQINKYWISPNNNSCQGLRGMSRMSAILSSIFSQAAPTGYLKTPCYFSNIWTYMCSHSLFLFFSFQCLRVWVSCPRLTVAPSWPVCWSSMFALERQLDLSLLECTKVSYMSVWGCFTLLITALYWIMKHQKSHDFILNFRLA